MFDNYRRFLDLLWIIILGKNIGKIQCLDGFLWVNGHGIFLLLGVHNSRTYFWERGCTPRVSIFFFWGGCLQGKSLCFKIAVFRVLQSLNFITENGPRGREPTENKIVGDDTRKLLTEQFSPLIDGLVGALHRFGGIPVIWRRFVVQINVLAREWICWTTCKPVRELCVLNLLQIKMTT